MPELKVSNATLIQRIKIVKVSVLTANISFPQDGAYLMTGGRAASHIDVLLALVSAVVHWKGACA